MFNKSFYNHTYRQTHRPQHNLLKRKWRLSHKDWVSNYNRNYYFKNKDRIYAHRWNQSYNVIVDGFTEDDS